MRAKLDRILIERSELAIELESEQQKNINLKVEVDRLTEAISTLEDKVSHVPDKVWEEIEREKEKIAEEQRKEERKRLLDIIKSKTLWYERMPAILDRETHFGFSVEDRKIVTTAIENSKHKPSGEISTNATVVHSTNEWWSASR